MSLKKGHYIPSWRADDELFDDAAEFAIFNFLLKQAHFKEKPHLVLVQGSTQKGGKNEPYFKEWAIEVGDVFTSKNKISAKWKMTRQTVQIKLLKLEAKGLISILLTEPALIIRIPNFKYFTTIPEHEHERAPSCHLPLRMVNMH